MSAKRQQISKRTRFEVFKRDLFACQYCGSTPPKVILHVDHIVAVANGGKNDLDNLVTSCDSCNLGKSAVPLTSVPQSLKDKAKEIAEREAQIVGYNAVLQARSSRIEDEAWQIAAVFEGVESLDKYDRQRLQSIRTFLKRMPFDSVRDAAQIALAKLPYSTYTRFRYFCGICWSRIKEAEGG